MSARGGTNRPSARPPRGGAGPEPDLPNAHLHSLDQARLHRGAEHLHRLGPRAVAEFVAELGHRTGTVPACLSLLSDYGRLTPALIRAAGGDRPLRPSLSVVPR